MIITIPIPITGAKERKLSINTVVSTALEVSSKLTNAVEPIKINIPFIKRKRLRNLEGDLQVIANAIRGRTTLGIPKANPLT